MNLSPFEEFDLSPELLKALEKKGYTRPTAIQLEAIPAAMEERDVLGSAPTGTGKTAAFLLPAIQHLLDYPRRKPGAPRILILTPTRELAMQVAEQAEELTQFTHLKIATITGGVAYQNHGEVFNSNQDIVVATPGRLLQYIKEENFDCRAVEMLIFDEPFSGFDPINVELLKKEILELRKKGTTIIFSTHNMASVEEICSHIALINKSKKIIEGPINQIRNKYANNTYRLICKYQPDFHPQEVIGEEYELLSEKIEDGQHELVLQRLVACPTNTLLRRLLDKTDIISYQKVIPGMNDIFIKLVKGEMVNDIKQEE